LIDRRCKTADEVARWVKMVQDRGLGGQGERGGQRAAEIDSAASTTSTPSTPPTGTAPTDYAGTAANAALVLLAVATSLLDRQIAAQAAAFEQEGGFTERLYRIRQDRKRGK
jgi:four helix bundle suffix protein